MTPKQFIKYVRKLEKNNLAICDGTTVNMALNFWDYIPIIAAAVGIPFLGAIVLKLKIFKLQ